MPPFIKKKKEGLEKRMIYKYLRARKFFAKLAATHSNGEVQELLAAGIELPDLGMVKIEADTRCLALIG